jgi:hypothetical protein
MKYTDEQLMQTEAFKEFVTKYIAKKYIEAKKAGEEYEVVGDLVTYLVSDSWRSEELKDLVDLYRNQLVLDDDAQALAKQFADIQEDLAYFEM